MKVFGLTGGIGMGKSAAEKIVRARGVPVIDTDSLARQIVEPGQPGLAEIRDAFGDGVLSPEGCLDRESLARIVFADPAARHKLEAITHPRILALWRAQVQEWRQQHPLAVVVIPLLFETAAEREFAATLCVACSANTQRLRLRERGWSDAQREQRLAAQWPIEKKMARADFVLWSEGTLDVLAAQLFHVLRLPQ